MTTLDHILHSASYQSGIEICPGCENHCTVKRFAFANGKMYYSGNQCEKVYSNAGDAPVRKGVNLFAEKNHLLWNRPTRPNAHPKDKMPLRIGIPRALGIYEDYPFWCTLLTQCGLEVVLSKGSTNKLYEQGIRSVMADNICFPAKLMHGHILDLVHKQVDRILYPWVVYEQKEDAGSRNSFNCPVVSGYSDVILSSLNPEKRFGIPLDAPVISFKDHELLRQSCLDYLLPLGVPKARIEHALQAALDAQQQYLKELETRSLQVLGRAMRENRMVILLAARPYHIDPLIEHKISQSIADMGVDVITENVAATLGADVYEEINALCQWAYPNRIFKAAYFVGNHAYQNLHMVELTSFGCGPDAFILDEVRQILGRYHKNLTVLKIDDVNNVGSLRLRVRSLIDSVSLEGSALATQPKNDKPFTTRPFLKEDRRRTIIAPYFAEGYSEYLSTVFGMMGYRLVSLPMGNRQDAEEGLQDANNDVCYPATIVIGSIMRALKSGEYDLQNTAVAITQTGGQCRASNYYSLIKNAMVSAGFADVPVVSVALGGGLKNAQPGFEIPWRKYWRAVLYTIFFADTMQKLYYPAVVRERTPGAAKRLYDHYTAAVQPLIAAQDYKGIMALLRQAVADFCEQTDTQKAVQRVGLVGEIYVKYNSFSNLNVVQWLIDHGVEVVPPALTGFFLTKLPNMHINKDLHIKDPGLPKWGATLINSAIMRFARRFDEICAPFTPYRPFTDIFENYRLARQVINPAADFGEGWFLSGEICHLAESGVKKVVSVQPFGCIANHVISKGIEKRLKQVYPDLSLLYLDFDSGTSEANVQNRLHFMISR